MAVPPYNEIRPGTSVSIVLKEDQPTGRQVQGTVADILTHGDHPRGVKVRLSDGRVGRVQEVLTDGGADLDTTSQAYNSANVWQSEQQYDAPPHPPPQHQYNFPQQDEPHWQSSNPTPNAYLGSAPPHQHPALRNDDLPSSLLPDEERGEQVETLQSYEDAHPPSQDDMNQEALQREFPDIDSSLIAAIYGDAKDLAATRETLQELGRAD